MIADDAHGSQSLLLQQSQAAQSHFAVIDQMSAKLNLAHYKEKLMLVNETNAEI